MALQKHFVVRELTHSGLEVKVDGMTGVNDSDIFYASLDSAKAAITNNIIGRPEHSSKTFTIIEVYKNG